MQFPFRDAEKGDTKRDEVTNTPTSGIEVNEMR